MVSRTKLESASTYKATRWIVAVGLVLLLVVSKTAWLPSEKSVEACVGEFSKWLSSIGKVIDEWSWWPTKDVLLNILNVIIRILALIAFLIFLLVLSIVGIVIAIVWLLAENSPCFVFLLKGVALLLTATSFYCITYLFVPEDRHLSMDELLIRCLVTGLSIAAATGILLFIVNLGLLRTLGLAICFGLPLGLVERFLVKWYKGKGVTKEGGWKVIIVACIWLITNAIIVYAELKLN